MALLVWRLRLPGRYQYDDIVDRVTAIVGLTFNVQVSIPRHAVILRRQHITFGTVARHVLRATKHARHQSWH